VVLSDPAPLFICGLFMVFVMAVLGVELGRVLFSIAPIRLDAHITYEIGEFADFVSIYQVSARLSLSPREGAHFWWCSATLTSCK
jgi:hypothetical protein